MRLRHGVLAEDSILRHRDFTLYVTGGWLSSSGTWLQNIVGAVVMLSLTGSVFMVGVLNFATFLPLLLFPLVGGVVSDSFSRRRVVVVASAIALALAALLAVLTFAGALQPWHLIAVAFFINTTYSFAKPALTSLLPSLVPRERLPHASAVMSMQYVGGQIVGSSIAAVALALGSPGLGFAINALTFLGPIVSMLCIKAAGELAAGRPREGGLKALREGLDYARRDPLVVLLITGVAMGSLISEAMRTLSPVFATRILGGNESTTGLIIGCYAVGSGLALLSIGRLLRSVAAARLSVAGFAIQGAGVLVFATSPVLPLTLFGASLIGAGLSLNIPMLTARLISHSPARLLGRVTAIHTVSNLGSRPVAALMAGTLASVFDPRLALLAFLCAVAVGLFVSITSGRRERSMPDFAAETTDPVDPLLEVAGS